MNLPQTTTAAATPNDRCPMSPPIPGTWQAQVRDWTIAASQYPPGSRERNHYLTKIIRVITPKLWRVYSPYYADALQQTMLYFSRAVCTTFDPDRASIVTWLNAYLRYRHRDLVREAAQDQARTVPVDAEFAKLSDRKGYVLEAIVSSDYGARDQLDRLMDWVEQDPDGVLRRVHLTGRPDINGQQLLRLRLSPQTKSWQAISQQLGQKVPTLSSFYQRKCLPLLRSFWLDQ